MILKDSGITGKMWELLKENLQGMRLGYFIAWTYFPEIPSSTSLLSLSSVCTQVFHDNTFPWKRCHVIGAVCTLEPSIALALALCTPSPVGAIRRACGV
jgi:hypothetical protein